MIAGRDLDALIAEQVMGWEPVQEPPHIYLAYNTPTGFRLPEEVPCYSTDITAAWAVVERISADHGAGVEVRSQLRNFKPGYACRIYGGDFEYPTAALQIYTQASTAPHAICLAALAALGERS